MSSGLFNVTVDCVYREGDKNGQAGAAVAKPCWTVPHRTFLGLHPQTPPQFQ